MTLQKRTFLITSFTFVILIGSLYVFLYSIIRNSFLSIEKQYSSENSLRVKDTIYQTLENLRAKQTDWAHWDDPYYFIDTRDKKFIENNLASDISDLGLSTLLILDEKSSFITAQQAGFDSDISKIPVDLLQYIQSHPSKFSFKTAEEVSKGILILPSGLTLIVAMGITTSDQTAPVKGAMVFTRVIDSALLQELKNVTHSDFTIAPRGNTPVLENVQGQSERIVDNNFVETILVLPDVDGVLNINLAVKTPRDIYHQGMTIVRYFSFILLGIACIFIFLNMSLLSGLVVKPIHGLIRDVKKVGDDPKAKSRMSTIGNGEFRELAEGINGMLNSLEKSFLENTEKTKDLASTRLDLEQKILDFQKQNETLEQSKKAVMNILDDSRRLEIEIRKQRDRNQAVISSMGEGLVVIDLEYKVRTMNPVAERLVGVTEKDAKGTFWHDVVTLYKGDIKVAPEERPFIKAFKDKMSIFLGLDDNVYYQTKDGRRMPISASVTPIFSETKEVTGAVILFHDITREKTEKTIIEQMVKERTQELVEKNIVLEKTQHDLAIASHEAEDEQAKLMASINSLTLGFMMADGHNNIITMNETIKEIFGLTGNTDVHLTEIEKFLYPVVDLHAIHTQCEKERKSVHIDSFEYRDKFYRLFVTPIVSPDEDMKLLGTVIVFEDISEAKILDRSREEFFSIASHELRTPLTAIRGNTELIRQYYGDKITDPDFKEMIDDIHSGSVRLITLVNDFLDMSRIEQGRMKYTLIPFNFTELIEKTLTMLEALCAEKKIALTFDKPQIPVMVIGDPDKSKEIILNLVGNAIKFTENGTIKVSFDPTIALPAGKSGQIVMAVTDSGRGISPANQSLLFRKFTQASSSILTRDTTKGTGLGLYISKLMGEGMGGSVFLAHSEEAKGSTFAFTLPKAG